MPERLGSGRGVTGFRGVAAVGWIVGSFFGASGLQALEVAALQTEYLTEPVGLDVAQPRLGWTLAASARDQRQTAYQVLVASSPERLEEGSGAVWDSGRVASTDNFGIVYDGPALESGRRYFWQVRVWDGQGKASPWSEPGSWQMALLDPTEWQADWIGAADEETSPLLRREFVVRGPVAQATAYAYASGWYELRLNGQKVGDRVLTPVNSNYQKGLFYDTYDVTQLVRPGANALGAWLGGGYNQNYSEYGYRWSQPLAALVQLEIRYRDGTTERVVTDDQWRATASPIVANDIYDGEAYDARLEFAGWDLPGFEDAEWQPVVTQAVEGGRLQASMMPPIKVVETRSPVHVSEPQPGVFVYDFGQNFAGWVRLRVQGPAGTRVMLRHAEELHPDGMLDTRTNRKAKATDTYTLRGGGEEESYEPRFTYHGFRYVELTGFPGRPTADTLEARVVHAAAESAGSFASSDPLLNRIHANFRWSIRSNLMGIPTDTATRDERTPCAMDSMAVEETTMFNFDTLQYFTKWLQDIRGSHGMPPNWAGQQVILPYNLYWHYGDKRILRQHFENMKQATDAFAAVADSQTYWANGFGDWAAPNFLGDYETSFSEGEIVNTAFFYRAIAVTAEVAELLGETADAELYRRRAEEIRQQFHAQHYHPDRHTYGSGRQVTSLLPLAFGMVPAELRSPVAAALQERVMGPDEGHLDTGIFGTRYLFEVLMDHGYASTAYHALTRTTYPSYGHQISLGATTNWEQWSYAGGMQTHNHAMFAGPGATFYTHLAGIRAAAPGFREIVIRPVIPAGLEKVAAEVRTPMGLVVSEWTTAAGYSHRVSIPPNATATLHLPVPTVRELSESGQPVANAPGVQAVREGDDGVTVTVGSGEYRFTAPRVRPHQ